MTRLRRFRRLAAGLVAMFVFAQFAGVVPRSAVAEPSAAVAASAHSSARAHECALHHSAAGLAEQDTSSHGRSADQHGIMSDQCCALHLLAGVVPLVTTATPADLATSALVSSPTDTGAGLGAPPLYRPPRSLAL